MDRILETARRGDVATVREHLARDPSLLFAKSGGHNRTLLWAATRGNRLDLVLDLLGAGADPNVPGRIRAEIAVLLPPYCIARRYRRQDLAEALLRAGAEIDVYSACWLGEAERVRRLLDASPARLHREQEADSVWRVTPLHFAVAGGQDALIRELLDRGAAVRPYTRLLSNIAARSKRPDLIETLLEAGADPDLAREFGVAQP